MNIVSNSAITQETVMGKRLVIEGGKSGISESKNTALRQLLSLYRISRLLSC